MSTVTHRFFQIEISLKDEKTPLAELNQLALNTISVLIPVMKTAITEEQERLQKLETECDCEECSPKEIKKIEGLYN